MKSKYKIHEVFNVVDDNFSEDSMLEQFTTKEEAKGFIDRCRKIKEEEYKKGEEEDYKENLIIVTEYLLEDEEDPSSEHIVESFSDRDQYSQWNKKYTAKEAKTRANRLLKRIRQIERDVEEEILNTTLKKLERKWKKLNKVKK